MKGIYAVRIHNLQQEIKRICNVTLSGNFTTPEDREFWVKRARKLNSELSALEDLARPSRQRSNK